MFFWTSPGPAEGLPSLASLLGWAATCGTLSEAWLARLVGVGCLNSQHRPSQTYCSGLVLGESWASEILRAGFGFDWYSFRLISRMLLGRFKVDFGSAWG